MGYHDDDFFDNFSCATQERRPSGAGRPAGETRAVLNRLSRAIGHLDFVRRMIEEGRDCPEVLIQLSAVKSALNSAGLTLLQQHIGACVAAAVETGDTRALDDLERTIASYIK